MNSCTHPCSHTSQFCFVNCSLRSKRFRLVDRGTRFSVLAAREMEREPRSLWPLDSGSSFFALNRTEALAAQTVLIVSSFHFPNYWNFDLECKHDKLKTALRAEKLLGLTVFSRKGPELNIQRPKDKTKRKKKHQQQQANKQTNNKAKYKTNYKKRTQNESVARVRTVTRCSQIWWYSCTWRMLIVIFSHFRAAHQQAVCVCLPAPPAPQQRLCFNVARSRFLKMM